LWLYLLSGWGSRLLASLMPPRALVYAFRSAEMPQGKIKRLVKDRGFGFVESDGENDLFFHHSEVQGVSIEDLREGQVVEYQVGRGQKGPCATGVRLASQ
jgi:CspA family cold shock protein